MCISVYLVKMYFSETKRRRKSTVTANRSQLLHFTVQMERNTNIHTHTRTRLESVKTNANHVKLGFCSHPEHKIAFGTFMSPLKYSRFNYDTRSLTYREMLCDFVFFFCDRRHSYYVGIRC